MAVAAATAAISAYGAYSASQDRDEALDQQDQAQQQRMAMAQDQMDFAEGHYDWARGEYGNIREEFAPVLSEIRSEALEEAEPDYGLITADTTAAFDANRDQHQRQLARYGVNPGDGQWGATERQYGIGQATAEVGARMGARRAADRDRFGRLSQLYGIGSQLQGQAMGQMGVGMSGYSGGTQMGANAAGQQARTAGNQANQYGQAAGQNMAGFTRNLGHMVDDVMASDASSAGMDPSQAHTLSEWQAGVGGGG